MPQRSRGIQQIRLSLADYAAFPKGGGARKASSLSVKSFEFGERVPSNSLQIPGDD
jgi:hypothetical protein